MTKVAMLQRGSLLTGEHGAYVIKAAAGRGGVGTVFKAKHTGKNRHVAVKVLHSDRFELTDAQRARFEMEIDTTMSIRDPHIVTLKTSNHNR